MRHVHYGAILFILLIDIKVSSFCQDPKPTYKT